MYFCAIIMKNTTMWKENLYQQVEILLREHDEFPIGEHQHSFFEMTYILEGSGDFCAHTMGSEREWHTYEAGDLFWYLPTGYICTPSVRIAAMSLSGLRRIMCSTALAAT